MQKKKINALKEPLTVIDLFSGCGGLSKGFEDAGFKVVLGIDNWKDSLDTFQRNHKGAGIICDDIKNVTGDFILKKSGMKKINVVVGGPPCQGFSLAGKRQHDDERNVLPYEFVRIVKELKPEFFLLENVLGLLSMEGGKVKERLLKKFRDLGYNVEVKDFYAHHYGVPQMRRRTVFLGNNLGIPVTFPEPTHLEPEKRKDNRKYLNPVTVGEAISDLPLLEDSMGTEEMDYSIAPQSDFQKFVRMNSDKIYNHTVSNHSEQTKKVISFVPEGCNWKSLPAKYQNIRSYANTWRRLDSRLPSVTIDTGHRHHFHYKACRVPTVRESARIQSFRDDFVFLGPRTSQFKQVGNAVPPLLAFAFAKEIKKTLKYARYDS
jgi:DNA (cytosine-5)-methyltransferase 1